MSDVRNYTKFKIYNNAGNVVYIGITNNMAEEVERFRIKMGTRVPFHKQGRRTIKSAAEAWKRHELEIYAASCNGEYPIYNREELNPLSLLEGFNPMRVSIRNVGVVREATLDLSKKLIIFCGPNNTGKTYISYLVNALVSSSSSFARREDCMLENNVDSADVVFRYKISKEYVMESYTAQVADVMANFDSIFGISNKQSDNLFNDAYVEYLGDEEMFWLYVKQRGLDVWTKYADYDVHIAKEPNNMNVRVVVKNAANRGGQKLFGGFYPVTDFVASVVIHYPLCDVTMFPVERNSIFTFSKELSINRNLLIDEIQNGGSRFSLAQMVRKRSTRYPRAIRDMLAIAEDTANLKRKNGYYEEFADELERSFLHGKIDIGKEGDVRFVCGGKSLPIHLTASIVKTLSSLTFYLRHIAKPDDLVIIDEPELNLHPDSQIALARLFARMINAGLRLLISTHSDYIIRELNNLIMISSHKENVKELAVSMEYDVDLESLHPNEVGAYLFQQGDDHMVAVKELPVEEDGFEVATIDNVIAQLNQQSEELFMHLKYGH